MPTHIVLDQAINEDDYLLFKRELNEVFLLLDYVSGQQKKSITELDIDVPASLYPSATMAEQRIHEKQAVPEGAANPPPTDKKVAKLDHFRVVQLVSSLQYSNPNSNPPNSTDLALLLFVKDRLNLIADPARGMTIAYTELFANKRFLRRPDLEQEKKKKDLTLAEDAFPELLTSVRKYRSYLTILRWAAPLLTLLAAFLLWSVVYGIQLTSKFEEDGKKTVELSKQIYQPSDLADICHYAKGVPTNLLFIIFPSKIRALKRSICDQSDSLLVQSTGQSGGHADAPTRGSDPQKPSQNPPISFTQEDIQSITRVLSIYTNYILPVIFGLLGAVASMLRDIGEKITDSILSPRDQVRASARLPLGFMAGVAVGLFISPTSTATSIASGSGVLTISASGIAFLAGYGADGFFKMLDELKSIIFATKTGK